MLYFRFRQDGKCISSGYVVIIYDDVKHCLRSLWKLWGVVDLKVISDVISGRLLSSRDAISLIKTIRIQRLVCIDEIIIPMLYDAIISIIVKK